MRSRDPKSTQRERRNHNRLCCWLCLRFVMDISVLWDVEYSKLTTDDESERAMQAMREKAFSRAMKIRMKRELYYDFTPHIMTLLWARKLVWNFMFRVRCVIALVRPVKSTCRCYFLLPLIGRNRAVHVTCIDILNSFRTIDPLLSLFDIFPECQAVNP